MSVKRFGPLADEGAPEQLSKNFRRAEFACPDACGYSAVDPGLVEGLQALRDVVGRSLLINSGCRCWKHNAVVGGTPASRHLTGEAADIRCPGLTARELYSHAAALCRFGGFGVDDARDMLHVDVRPKLARWCYRDGKQAPWLDVAASTSSA